MGLKSSVPFRLERSMLSVPGINPPMFSKALNSEADVIMLDCEDSVSVDDKEQARKNIAEALREMDWKGAGKSVLVRVNALDTPFMYRDLIDIVESSGEYIDGIMVPKVNGESDVKMVECLLNQMEMRLGFRNRIGIEALIETVEGVMNLNTIAASSPRLEALHFGSGDFAASCRARTVAIGGVNPNYPGDQWHYIMERIVIAARANGLRAIDCAYGDFNDDQGYVEAAKRAAALGFEGKWAIHPRQIRLANEVMTPPKHELENAQRVLDAMDEAAKQGKGAATLDGKMVDIASVRMAQNIVDIYQAIDQKSSNR